MSWFAPIVDAQYTQAKKCGTGYVLTKEQKREIRSKVNRYHKRTRKRALVIREIAIRLGCYEGTVRRAAK